MFVTKRSNPKYEPVDTYFKNTSMLLHGENIDAANYPRIDYAGGGGYFFNGSTSYLTAPDSANFELGSNAFTIELWIYPTSTAAEQILINKVATGSVVGSFDIRMSTTGTIRTLVATTAGVNWSDNSESTLTVNFNQWNHVAYVRSGNNFTRYINGVSAGVYTAAITLVNEATTLNVGANGNGSSKFTGYMSNVRVVNGSAVYTADFTPPTEPLNVITNTVLLLKAKTIGSPADSALGTTITVNGGVQAFPTFSPFLYNQSSAFPPGGTSSGAMDINTSDGSTGSGSGQPYIDVSQNKIPVTTVGFLGQGTFSPYSQTGYSGYFDGSGDYLTVASNAGFALGTGDFTVECWIHPTAWTNDNGTFIDFRQVGAASQVKPRLFVASGTLAYMVSNANQITTTLASLNTWYHIALVRSSGSTKLYVNGVQAGSTYTDANDYGSVAQDIVIGQVGDSRSFATGYFAGFISNVRVVKGTAVYTVNFTPPVRKFEAITNTTLLTLQNPYVKDNSTNNLTLTRVGDVTVRPFSPFVKSYSAPSNLGSSVYNNAATRYLIMRDGKYQNATQFGLRDFCVETWVYFETLGSDRLMVESWASSVGWQLYYKTSTGFFVWQIAGTIRVSSTTTPVIGQWYHVALSRNNYVLRMYVNGVLETTVTPDNTDYTQVSPLATGIQFSTLTLPMAGYLSDVRITTGNPVYGTGSFTPPAGPLQPIEGTQFLLKAKEIGIKDVTGKNNAQVFYNTRISTAIKKFNTGSILFGGTSDYIQIPYNVNNHHMANRDFTVECWAYPAGNDSVGRIINAWNTGTTSYASWEMYWQNGNTFGAQFSSAGTAANATLVSTTSWHGTYGTPQRNNWYHLALVRANSVFTFYVNGASAGSNTQPSAYTLQVPDTVTIAARRSGASYVEPFNGCLDEIRITPGIARYTGNFTVPDRAFPDR